MHTIRRNDRAITKEESFELLTKAEYGILSSVGPGNQPYGVPLSFCVCDQNIYFHCATEGHKIKNFSQNPKVSFCVVGDTCVLPDKFSTKYESTVVFGSISEVFESEKQLALEGLLHKYSSCYLEEGLKYIEALNKKARVFKITITEITGKSRK